MQQIKVDLVTRKNWTRQNLNKKLGSKLLEFCKTRTKKSSPDLFNFYVVLAGHDMVTHAGRAITCRRKFRAPSLQTQSKKKTELPKTLVLTGKCLKVSDEKKYTSSVDQTTPRNTWPLKATIEDWPCNQEEMHRRKFEKETFRLELLEFCKTRTKKSNPDMFSVYVDLAVARHDMVTDIAGYHVQVQTQSLIITRKVHKMRTFRKHGFSWENVWRLQTKKKWNKLLVSTKQH